VLEERCQGSRSATLSVRVFRVNRSAAETSSKNPRSTTLSNVIYYSGWRVGEMSVKNVRVTSFSSVDIDIKEKDIFC
jgi:hypothetical protein